MALRFNGSFQPFGIWDKANLNKHSLNLNVLFLISVTLNVSNPVELFLPGKLFCLDICKHSYIGKPVQTFLKHFVSFQLRQKFQYRYVSYNARQINGSFYTGIASANLRPHPSLQTAVRRSGGNKPRLCF